MCSVDDVGRADAATAEGRLTWTSSRPSATTFSCQASALVGVLNLYLRAVLLGRRTRYSLTRASLDAEIPDDEAARRAGGEAQPLARTARCWGGDRRQVDPSTTPACTRSSTTLPVAGLAHLRTPWPRGAPGGPRPRYPPQQRGPHRQPEVRGDRGHGPQARPLGLRSQCRRRWRLLQFERQLNASTLQETCRRPKGKDQRQWPGFDCSAPLAPDSTELSTPNLGSSESQKSLKWRLVLAPPVCAASVPSVTLRNVPPLDAGVLAAEDDERHVLLVVVPGARHLGQVDDDGVVDQHVAVDVGLGRELLQRLRGRRRVELIDLVQPVARRRVRRSGLLWLGGW